MYGNPSIISLMAQIASIAFLIFINPSPKYSITHFIILTRLKSASLYVASQFKQIAVWKVSAIFRSQTSVPSASNRASYPAIVETPKFNPPHFLHFIIMGNLTRQRPKQVHLKMRLRLCRPSIFPAFFAQLDRSFLSTF